MQKTSELKKANKKIPHLAAVLVGNDGASETYVSSKVKACKEVGFNSLVLHLASDVREDELLDTVKTLNLDEEIDGILVQLPLPKHISEEKIIALIDPKKDVDGFHPLNIGKLVKGVETFIPATPYGILLLLQHYKIETKGKYVAVVGRSNIVGRPVSILLSRNDDCANCTVTLCHSHTKNLKEICLQADIIITALGKPGFLKADMVKQNVIIIDVGITRVNDDSAKGYALKGDVDFKNVATKTSYITPVPGGVGPMTIAALLINTFKACSQNSDV